MFGICVVITLLWFSFLELSTGISTLQMQSVCLLLFSHQILDSESGFYQVKVTIERERVFY